MQAQADAILDAMQRAAAGFCGTHARRRTIDSTAKFASTADDAYASLSSTLSQCESSVMTLRSQHQAADTEVTEAIAAGQRLGQFLKDVEKMHNEQVAIHGTAARR